MGLVVRLFKNTTYLTFGNQIGNLLQFLFFLYFARQFGEEVVGRYAFAFSFTFVFSILADLGLSGYLIREVARDRSGNRQIFAKCLTLRLISLAVFSLLAIVTILVFNSSFSQETVRMIVLLGLFQVFFSIADVFLGEFKGHDRMGLVALLNMFVRFLVSGAGIFLITLGFDFLVVLVSFPIGSFIYMIVCVYLSFAYFGDIRLKFENLDLKGVFIQVLPFALTIIFVEIFYHQDILMLRFLQDDQAVGIYSVANKIVLAVLGILHFVHTALLPTFSRLYVDSRSKLIDIAKKSLRYLLLAALPLAVLMYGTSGKIIGFLFPGGFEHSVDVLKVLSWTLAFGFAAATYSVLLTAINRQKEKVVVVGVCLAVNFVLNLVLIPRLSFTGAAIAKLSSEGLHFVLMAYLASKYLAPIWINKIFVKALLSSGLLYLSITIFYDWNLLYLLGISVLVYPLALAILRAYTKEEIELVKRLHPRVLLNSGIFRPNGSGRP